VAEPELWIVGGPNGAGKTTCVQREPITELLPGVAFLNPDEYTLKKIRSLEYQGFHDAPADVQMRLFVESADEVYAELEQAIARGEAVGVESVLSSPKYQPLVETVIARGGFFGLIYVALSSPELARERVAGRVSRGGHGVPDEKIALRWRRSLANLGWFARRASSFWIVDNSDSDLARPRLIVASGQEGRLEYLSPDAFPELDTALAMLPRSPPPESTENGA
jgi:predicted ABC-type ATPase